MPSYKETPKPKILPTPEDPAVSDSPEPIKLAADPQSLAALASQGRDAILGKLRAHQAETVAKQAAYIPPQPTARQMSQTELEMEAGRRAVAKAEAAKLAQMPRQRDPSDGYTTPVFRPSDHVPGFDQGKIDAKVLK